MNIFGTECPVIVVVVGRDRIAALRKAAHTILLYIVACSVDFCPCAFAGIRASPSEGTDAHSSHWHYPYTSNKVFLLIYVGGVDSLSVEHTHLIVQ